MAKKNKVEIIVSAKDLASRQFNRLSRDISSFSRTATNRLNTVTSSVFSLQGAVVALAGGYGLERLSASFLDTASSFEMLEIKLDKLTKGRGTETLERINDWAREMPVNTREAIDTFSMMQAMGLQPTIDKMETLVDVASVMGADAMPRVARGLGQIKTLGKLSAEELNQLAEAGINARKYLSEAFGGKTVEEIQKAKISVDEIIQAIWTGLEKDFKGAARSAMNTWSGLVTTFSSNWTEIEKKIMEAGVFDELKTQLSAVNEEFETWLETNEDLIAQKVPEYIEEVKDGLSAAYEIIKDNKDILEYGIIGLALWGKRGALIGATIGHFVGEVKKAKKHKLESEEDRLGNLQKEILEAIAMREKAKSGLFGFLAKNQKTDERLATALAVVEAEQERVRGDVYRKMANKVVEANQAKAMRRIKSLAKDIVRDVYRFEPDEAGAKKPKPTGPSKEELKLAAFDYRKSIQEWEKKRKEGLYELASPGDMYLGTFGGTDIFSAGPIQEMMDAFDELGEKWSAGLGEEVLPLTPVEQFKEGFLVTLDETKSAWIDWTDEGTLMAERFRDAVTNAVGDTMFAILKGDFEDIGDAWQSALDNMLRAVSDFVAKALVRFAVITALDLATGGGFSAGTSVLSKLFKFQEGTPYVPRTMPALVHREERIINAPDNRELMSIMRSLKGQPGQGAGRQGTTNLYFINQGMITTDDVDAWIGERMEKHQQRRAGDQYSIDELSSVGLDI